MKLLDCFNFTEKSSSIVTLQFQTISPWLQIFENGCKFDKFRVSVRVGFTEKVKGMDIHQILTTMSSMGKTDKSPLTAKAKATH